MSIERSILIRIWMTHCVCFSSYTSPTSVFRCFQHPSPTWTVHDHKPWLSISFSSSTCNFRHCHKLCVRLSSLRVTSSFTVPYSMSASAAPFIATYSPLPWLYSYQTFDRPLLNCLRLVSIYQGHFILPFSPPKRFVWPSETLVNPFRDCQHSAHLCISRFHVSTLFCFDFSLPWSFTALITHFWFLIFDFSFLIPHAWLPIACALSPLKLLAAFDFSSCDFPLLCLSSSSASVRNKFLSSSLLHSFHTLVHHCLIGRRFTCVVGLIGAWSVTCFSSLSVSFRSLSRVSVFFNRCIQSPKTFSCVGSTRLLTVLHTIQLQILPLSLFTSTQTLPHKWRKLLSRSSSQSLHTLGLC